MNSQEIKTIKRGGKRAGAGRKPRVFTQKITDVAQAVLDEVNAKEKWKALLNCGEAKVIADVMKYLTDRVHGKPAQRIEGGDKPLTIQFSWGSTPDWLPKK